MKKIIDSIKYIIKYSSSFSKISPTSRQKIKVIIARNRATDANPNTSMKGHNEKSTHLYTKTHKGHSIPSFSKGV